MLIKPTVPLSNSMPLRHPCSSVENTMIVAGKRKYMDSSSVKADQSTGICSNSVNRHIDQDQIAQLNVKRLRPLDMTRVRSLVLANNHVNNDIQSNSCTWKSYPMCDKQLTCNDKQVHNRAFQLPTLTDNDYYTEPLIDELRSCFNDQGQCFVKKFTVGRRYYGSVTFQGSNMNLAGLDLNRLSKCARCQLA
jgi:hypothetical protein